MTVASSIRSAAARCGLVLALVSLPPSGVRAEPDDAVGSRPLPPEPSIRGAVRAEGAGRPRITTRMERGYPLGLTLSPITPAVTARWREIARSADRRDDVFAKVGDSMSQSRAFMTCFARDEVRLAGRAHLRETIEHFRAGDAGGVSPFARDSEATAVGWRTISVLRGPLDRELRRTQPRFATLMFGTNDMQNGRPWVFARRMWRVVDRLIENGTIPIMSSILPRDDDAERDKQVPLYSMIVRALAQSRLVPFIDYRREMEQLPGRGLARDGLHANVLVEDGRGRACDFTEEGLRYGHNVRNLLNLRMLDRLRRVVIEGEPAPDPAWPAARGDGTARAPFEMTHIPYAVVRPASDEPHVYRFTLRAPSRIHLRAFTREGRTPEVTLGNRSGAGRRGLVARLPAGTHTLRIATHASAREYMLVVDRVLPGTVRRNPFGG